jgi:hypothetical protein
MAEYVPRVLLDEQWDEAPDRAVVESGVLPADQSIDVLGGNLGELENQSPLDVR